MKLKNIILAISAATAINMAAEECELHITVAPISQGEDVPEQSADYLLTRLTNVVTASGVTGDDTYSQFFITGKFNHIYQDVVPGPPMQNVLRTSLTLYIGDLVSKKIYSSTSFELRGVGTSDQRAFINALGAINARNAEFKKFLDAGKTKIIAYYDANYPQILQQAKRAAAMNNFDEALFHATQIPSCSKGYAEAEKVTLTIYQEYIDYAGTQLLLAAEAAWAAGHDLPAARKALEYLLQIDPDSKAMAGAEKLLAEIKESIKDDREFELRQKYKDSIDLERRKIDAARAVGVAWGSGQQPSTTYIEWIR